MNAREQGFLLLTAHLGDPERKPLTVAQFRELTRRVRAMERPQADESLTPADLRAIGCSDETAQRIVQLLSQTEQLQWYLERGRAVSCQPITRVSDSYPAAVRKCLALEAPGALWAKGDVSLLRRPAVSLVGSRELLPENHAFAYEVGKQAAKQNFVLISGDARGADRTAQSACLEHGGWVISVVADPLQEHPKNDRILYLAEEGFDLEFAAHRALSRNRIIHCLGSRVFVAQCRLEKGGTWEGTTQNLRHDWSPVFCFDDGSPAHIQLQQMGAQTVGFNDLQHISKLQASALSFLDQ